MKKLLLFVCILICTFAKGQIARGIVPDTISDLTQLQNLRKGTVIFYVPDSSIRYWSGTSLLTVYDSLHFRNNLFANMHDSIGFGTKADAKLTISNVYCTTCPAPQTGTLLHAISEGTVNGRTSMDSYNNGGAQGSIIQGRRGRGTANSPSAALTDDILFATGADGYGQTGFHNISLGGMSVRADSIFTDASAPTYINITTTPHGSLTAITRLRINSDGSLLIPTLNTSNGLVHNDATGKLSSSLLTASEVTTALGFTPTNTDTTSLSNRINTKFNIVDTLNKWQPKGAYLTANQNITVSGDATGAGTTSIPLTLATVNSNIGTFNGSYTVNAKGLVTAAANTVFNSAPARVLSTTGTDNTFTISSTKNARVHYTINFAYALTLAQTNGYVELDYSTNGGTSWITVASVSYVITLAVTLNGNTDHVLSGEIPANALVRLYRINATNSTVTAPTTKQQEITY